MSTNEFLKNIGAKKKLIHGYKIKLKRKYYKFKKKCCKLKVGTN